MVGEHSAQRRFSLSVVSGLALVGIGCATAPGGKDEFATDVRGTVAPGDPESHLLVAGPAMLLHLSTEHADGVTLFRAVRREGTAADCVAGPQRKGDIIEMAHGSLYVTEKESVCATVANGVSLAWHAREVGHPMRPHVVIEHQASLP